MELHNIKIREGVHETMAPALIERCKGDVKMASFFHSLAAGMRGEVVDNDSLRANTPDMKSRRI